MFASKIISHINLIFKRYPIERVLLNKKLLIYNIVKMNIKK